MKTLIKILQMKEDHLLQVLNTVVEPFGERYYKEGEYLYVKSPTDHPIVLLAHVDTVSITSCLPKIEGNIITNGMNAPLGGDDRCGVWAMLRVCDALKKLNLPLPSLIFTSGEEMGGVGMEKLIKDGVFDPTGVKLLVCLDRKGANDWVDYISVPKEVKTYIESFGYIESNGSYADVRDLSSDTLIPGINLSVGYYHQHTSSEKIHFDELEMCVKRVVKICQNPITELYPVIKPKYDDLGWGKSVYNRSGWGGGGAKKTAGIGEDTFEWTKCEWCEQWALDKEWDVELDCCNKCANDIKEGKDAHEIGEVEDWMDMVDYAIQDATDYHWKCRECNKPWENCACGSVFKAVCDKIEALKTDEEQELAWEFVCEKLTEGDRVLALIDAYHDKEVVKK